MDTNIKHKITAMRATRSFCVSVDFSRSISPEGVIAGTSPLGVGELPLGAGTLPLGESPADGWVLGGVGVPGGVIF